MTQKNNLKMVDIEKHIGDRIRERRLLLGLTQQELADAIGVTYQQAHKYEKGINRVSAGRLLDIANQLGVSVNFFYDGLDSDNVELDRKQKLSLEIARDFSLIKSQRHKDALSVVARALSAKD